VIGRRFDDLRRKNLTVAADLPMPLIAQSASPPLFFNIALLFLSRAVETNAGRMT